MKLKTGLTMFADEDEALDIRPITGHAPAVVLCAGDLDVQFASIEACFTWAQRIADMAYDALWSSDLQGG